MTAMAMANETTASNEMTNPRIGAYLQRLDAALAGVPATEKGEILREIETHILDSCFGAQDPSGTLDRVLRLLGTPEELGDRYATEFLLTRASRSFSPWLLLQTCWRWGRLGIKGTLAFFIGLFGYGLALGLTVAVFLKPLFPGKVGMWIGSGQFVIGITDHPEATHELLGRSFVPVMAAAAFAIAIGTTQALRWMIRKRSRADSPRRVPT